MTGSQLCSKLSGQCNVKVVNAILHGPCMGVRVLCVFLRFLSVDMLEDQTSPGCSKCQ